jgi:hypothetical protein
MARHRHHWLATLVVAVAASASIATSALPKEPRGYPAWVVTAGEKHTQQCVDLYAWVSKSGKTGLGLSLELRSKGDCMLQITKAELQLEGISVPAADLWDPLDMKGHSLLFAYIPFEFDNNEAWNDELRDGVIELHMTTNGNPGPAWRITAEHRRNATHREKNAAPWEDTKAIAK